MTILQILQTIFAIISGAAVQPGIDLLFYFLNVITFWSGWL